MRKTTYFASRPGEGWPRPEQIARYFLEPPAKRWFFETRNDSAKFDGEGVEGTEHLEPNKGRIDIRLMMWGHPTLGVLLIWSKWGGGHQQTYSSKGDLSRLRELVRSTHNTPLPVGLFVPYGTAWKAVKEFLENDGALPKSIEWIANRDLRPIRFPILDPRRAIWPQPETPPERAICISHSLSARRARAAQSDSASSAM